MANLESRIAMLEEAGKSNPLIDSFHTLACGLAQDQVRPEPKKPGDLTLALKQLAEYLPN